MTNCRRWNEANRYRATYVLVALAVLVLLCKVPCAGLAACTWTPDGSYCEAGQASAEVALLNCDGYGVPVSGIYGLSCDSCTVYPAVGVWFKDYDELTCIDPAEGRQCFVDCLRDGYSITVDPAPPSGYSSYYLGLRGTFNYVYRLWLNYAPAGVYTVRVDGLRDVGDLETDPSLPVGTCYAGLAGTGGGTRQDIEAPGASATCTIRVVRVNSGTDCDGDGDIDSADNAVENTTGRSISTSQDPVPVTLSYPAPAMQNGDKLVLAILEGSEGLTVWDSQEATATQIGLPKEYVVGGPEGIPSTVYVKGKCGGTATLNWQAQIEGMTGNAYDRILFNVTDDTDPSPGAAYCEPYTAGSFITVSYTGASDNCSLDHMELWYKFGVSGEWTHSDEVLSSSPTGSFDFSPQDGLGNYSFFLVAEDVAGRRSAVAAGEGHCSTVYSAGTIITEELNYFSSLVTYCTN